jgi:hypothetical protein
MSRRARLAPPGHAADLQVRGEIPSRHVVRPGCAHTAIRGRETVADNITAPTVIPCFPAPANTRVSGSRCTGKEPASDSSGAQAFLAAVMWFGD